MFPIVNITCSDIYLLFLVFAGRIVLEALILTSAVVASLTGYTFWASKKGKDFSYLGPILFSSLIVLLFTGFIQVMFLFLSMFTNYLLTLHHLVKTRTHPWIYFDVHIIIIKNPHPFTPPPLTQIFNSNHAALNLMYFFCLMAYYSEVNAK